MTLRYEQLSDGQSNAGARTSDKHSFHDLENGFELREALRVAPALIPILTIAPMQECPLQRILVLVNHVKDSFVSKMSILVPCCR